MGCRPEHARVFKSKLCWYLYSAYLVGCIVWYSVQVVYSFVLHNMWICTCALVSIQMLCAAVMLQVSSHADRMHIFYSYLLIYCVNFFIILWIPQNCLSSYCWIGDAGMCWCPNFQCCRIIHGFVWLVKMIFRWICWAVKYSRIFFWDSGIMSTNFLCMNCQNFLNTDFIIYAVIEKGWNCYVNVYFPTFSEEQYFTVVLPHSTLLN